MDFEFAAKRLANDHSKLKSGRGRTGTGPPVVSLKAKREADMRKKQQERLQQQRLVTRRDVAYRQAYMNQCDRSLGVKSLQGGATSPTTGLQLQATSIHGQGDKIALSSSVLEYLTSSGNDLTTPGSPWTFRIGILNPQYQFPASPLLQMMSAPFHSASSRPAGPGQVGGDTITDDDTVMDEWNDSEDEDDDDDDDDDKAKEIYLDELKHKYLSVTYGSVVEFTQEDGHIGLPEPIAVALLDPSRVNSTTPIPVTRTVDPATATEKGGSDDDDDNNNDGDDVMQPEQDEGEKTPGHLAWGAFDVPSASIEVSMVNLPKGRACTLVPTAQAVRNGFYDLKDVKLVLEQSLIRTRATLSVHDTVHTWHRGKKFDLRVTQVTPATYGAVTCINTDIEVDIGEAEQAEESSSMDTETQAQQQTPDDSAPIIGGQVLGGGSVGRRLDDAAAPVQAAAPPAVTTTLDSLLPEPPADQTTGVCTVQIRADGAHGKRRFDVLTARLEDLFAFAETLTHGETNFRLVTRFPRRVFDRPHANEENNTLESSHLLVDSGIQAGQEAFLVERL
jgi:hypothetical protein